MRRLFFVAAILLCPIAAHAQDLFADVSVDEAIAMMKESSSQYLTGIFKEVDATGIDQYVDVEIKNVYSISDFSIGSLLPELETNKAYFSGLNPSRKTTAKRERILQLSREHMTTIIGYAALIDYAGITKYHEKVHLTRLFFFDWTGKVIGVRSESYDRNDYSSKLVYQLIKRLTSILIAQNDPTFLPDEVWVSETKISSIDKRDFKMQWCYTLEKNKPLDDGSEKGFAMIYYYQIQNGVFTTKSILAICADYVLKDNKITFDYQHAAIIFYIVDPEDCEAYDPGDFTDFRLSGLRESLVMTRKTDKIIRAAASVPETFEIIDSKTVKMSEPLEGLTYTFSMHIDNCVNEKLLNP